MRPFHVASFLLGVAKAGYPLAATSGAILQIPMANNNNLPVTLSTSSSWVQNCWTTHRVGPVNFSGPRLTFANWYILTNGEHAGYYDFTLRAGIYYNGMFYAATFNGVRDVTIPANFGQATSDPIIDPATGLPLVMAAGSVFFVTNRRVATDLGAAGSYSVLSNTGGASVRQDGIINGVDISRDCTLGVGLGYGGKFLQPPTINNTTGAITAILADPANNGTGYTAPLSIGAWYGPAGQGQPGALVPGVGLSGYANASGGHLTNATLNPGGGGTLHNSATPPYVFAYGGGNGGFASTTATYGPCLISGTPLSPVESVLLLGDSIGSGYNSVDAIGDRNASFGFWEQCIAGNYPIMKMCQVGTSAAGWKGNNAHQLNYLSTLKGLGISFSRVVVEFGTNDFLTNTNSNVLSFTQGCIAQCAQAIQGIYPGVKVHMQTVPPANHTTASTNLYTTVAEQVPYNANYALGGPVDQYNAAMRGGTGPANDGFFDVRQYMQDSTVTTAWRTDSYGGGTAFCAGDGLHPSVQVGIPYLVKNASFSFGGSVSQMLWDDGNSVTWEDGSNVIWS